MPDGAFRTSVLRLAQQEGVEVDDVLVADASRRTTTLNAYVSGFGGTRRVVVYDNLLDALPPDEARAVVAHELAHAKNHDVLIGTALGALGSVGRGGPAGAPARLRRLRRWLGGTRPGGSGGPRPRARPRGAVGCSSEPRVNTVSRAIEARADR